MKVEQRGGKGCTCDPVTRKARNERSATDGRTAGQRSRTGYAESVTRVRLRAFDEKRAESPNAITERGTRSGYARVPRV